MAVFDTIVIGAGISGLTSAYQLANHKHHRVLLLEKHETSGGLLSTYYPACDDSFWLEMGAHTLYNSYSHLIKLLDELGEGARVLHRQKCPFWLFHQGRFRRVLTTINPFRMALGLINMKRLDATDRRVADYYSQVFGRKNYQRILRYAFNAVLSQEADDFPAELLFKSYARRKDYPRSFTLDGGLASLAQTLIERSEAYFKPNQQVLKLTQDNHNWLVQTPTDEFQARQVILATPSCVSSGLLRSASAFQAAQAIDRIRRSPVESHGFVLDPHAMRHIKPFAGAVGINQPFYSILSRDVVPHEKYRGVVMHMPYQGNNQSNDQTRYASARKLISQILSLPDNAFIEQTCCDQSVPKLNTDYKSIQKEMIGHLPEGMHVTGNYFARLAIEDCVRQAKQCIDKLN